MKLLKTVTLILIPFILFLSSCTSTLPTELDSSLIVNEVEAIKASDSIIQSTDQVQGKGTVHFIAVATDYVGSGSGDLTGALHDAAEMGAIYTARLAEKNIPYTEKYFISEWEKGPDAPDYPSVQNIFDYIDNLKVSENDLIFFFFSGHTYKNETFDYCFTIGMNEERNNTYSVPYRQLIRKLDEKNCRSVAMFESCFGGDPADYATDKVTLLTSSSNGNKSYSVKYLDSREYHGAFTYHVLMGLAWRHTDDFFRTIISGDREYPVYGKLMKTEGDKKLSTIIEEVGAIEGYTKKQIPAMYGQDMYLFGYFNPIENN